MIQPLNIKSSLIISNLCDYSDAYIFVTGDITAAGGYQILKLNLRIVFLLQDL